jgi:hypothetical protein
MASSGIIQGYNNPALASPIRIGSIGSLPPRIADFSTGLTQRESIPTVPVNDPLASPRYSPNFNQLSVPSSLGNIPIITNSNTMPIMPIVESVNTRIPTQQVIPDRPRDNVSIKSLDNILNKRLESHGYRIVNTIYINNRGQKEAKFIDAIDSRGHRIFIELNVDSVVVNQGSDLTVSEGDATNSCVSHAIRMGILGTIGRKVSGVAFKCKNGIVLTYNSLKGPVKESFLTLPSDNNLAIMPLILVTSIFENPTVSLEMTSRATNDIISAIRNISIADAKETEKSIANFSRAAEKVNIDIISNMDAVIKSLQEHEKIRANYDVGTVPSETYKSLTNVINKHIVDIYRMYEASRGLESVRSKLNALLQEMTNINIRSSAPTNS